MLGQTGVAVESSFCSVIASMKPSIEDAANDISYFIFPILDVFKVASNMEDKTMFINSDGKKPCVKASLRLH